MSKYVTEWKQYENSTNRTEVSVHSSFVSLSPMTAISTKENMNYQTN